MPEPADLRRTDSDLEPVDKKTYIQSPKGPHPIWYADRDGSAIFEGDIILGSVDDMEAVRRSVDEGEGSGMLGGVRIYDSNHETLYLWPTWTSSGLRAVTYQNHLKNAGLKKNLERAMLYFEDAFEIIFTTNTKPGRNRLQVVTQSGLNAASATVGYIENGKRELKLNWAHGYGTILHELCHVLGMWHEHSRADRDTYVKVYANRIMPDKLHNFNIEPLQQMVGGYDYQSIMHYDKHAFAKHLVDVTIEPKQKGVSIGQTSRLSSGDFLTLGKMYGFKRVFQKIAPTTIGVASGRLVTLDDKGSVHVAKQRDGGELSPWEALSRPKSEFLVDVAAAAPWSRAYMVFGMNKDGRLFFKLIDEHARKRKPWGTLSGPKGVRLTRIAALGTGKVSLEIFGLDSNGYVWSRRRSNAGWAPWVNLVRPKSMPLQTLSVNRVSPSRYLLMGIGKDGNLYRKLMGATSKFRDEWSKISVPSGETITNAAATQTDTDTYHIFLCNARGNLFRKVIVKGKPKGGWTQLSRPRGYGISDLTAIGWGSKKFGLYGVGDNGQIFQKQSLAKDHLKGWSVAHWDLYPSHVPA